MARCPAEGWRWQAQAEAHRPRPQPEMTTVWPSSRTLPTWETDGLRLLLTGALPSTVPLTRAGTRCCELAWLSAGAGVPCTGVHRRSLRGVWTSPSFPALSVITSVQSVAVSCSHGFYDGVGGTARARRNGRGR